jgi:branched-chain amino acid transport system substrate-binding protein
VKAARPTAIGLTLLALTALTGACARAGTDRPKLRGELPIGVLAPVSGDQAQRGRDLVNGASLAAAEINEHGGVLGRRVTLAVENDGCAPDTAKQAATRLVAQNVVGGVGGVCNDATRSATEVLAAADKPFLVSSADSGSLVGAERPFTFLVNGTVYQEALAAVHWMGYRSAQRVAVVGDSSPESRELSGLVGREVQTDVVDKRTAGPRQQDLTAAAAATLRSRPDFVYWTGTADAGGRLVRELRRAGYHGYFMASSPSDRPEFLAAAGKDGEGAFVTTTARPRLLPATTSWTDRFHRRFKQDPGRDAMQVYDALRALAEAVRQAGDTRGTKVAESLQRLAGFSTFMGELQFAPDHSMAYDNHVIAVVRNGAITLASRLRTD